MTARLETGPVTAITALFIGRAGDLILATPMLRALSQKFPQARVRLVIQGLCAETAALIPWVDDVAALQRFHKVAANVKVTAALFTAPCDLFVDLNPSFSRAAAALTALIRAPLKVGFRKGRLDGIFTHQVDGPGAAETVLDCYARLAAVLEAPYEAKLELRLNLADETRADRVITGLGLGRGPRLLLHAGNPKRSDHGWPEDKFVELINRIAHNRPDIRLIFLSGAGEQQQAEELAGKLKVSVSVLPRLPAGVVAALMRRVDMCVPNISGTAHLAAAMGTPTFSVHSRGVDADEAWEALEPVLPPAVRPAS